MRLTLRLAGAVSFLFASLVSGGCAPLTAPCTRDDECARSVCVEGRCLDETIGETPDLGPIDAAERSLVDQLIDARREPLHALRPWLLTPGDDEVPPVVPPDEPSPIPPPINDDDDDELRASCDDILAHDPDAVSGFYTVRARDGASVVVECVMRADGGWTIVADLARDGCPEGWSSSIYGCERPNYNATQIASAFFTMPAEYRDVHGGARAWSTGNNRAFDVGLTYDGAEADELYVDGLALSINEGSARQHLWTFAAGDSNAPYSASACPAHGGASPPSDVEDAYACDARFGYAYALWDGDEGDEDHGDFRRAGAPKGDRLEARLMSPLVGFQSPVFVTELFIAVR